MNYKLVITHNAEVLIDQLINYLLYRLKSKQAAKNLVTEIEKIFNRLEDNPFQFPLSKDEYLSYKQYREAVLVDMNYVIVFKVDESQVYILGVFHQLEQYENKLSDQNFSYKV